MSECNNFTNYLPAARNLLVSLLVDGRIHAEIFVLQFGFDQNGLTMTSILLMSAGVVLVVMIVWAIVDLRK